MIDLINFNYERNNLGFSKFYRFSDFKIVFGSDDNKNRRAVENKNVDILMSPEKIKKTDFMHSRDAGLNQVLCKLAKKNNVAIGFNFNDVLNSESRALVIGKMMQNVKLCRKYKVKMVIVSGANNEFELKNAQELFSFGIVLGMTPGEARGALNFEKES